MPQLTLCLVRHGETEANKAEILQGHGLIGFRPGSKSGFTHSQSHNFGTV